MNAPLFCTYTFTVIPAKAETQPVRVRALNGLYARVQHKEFIALADARRPGSRFRGNDNLGQIASRTPPKKAAAPKAAADLMLEALA